MFKLFLDNFDNFWQFGQYLDTFDFSGQFDNFWQSHRLVTFETLITIPPIENMNSWQSVWPHIKSETGQHSCDVILMASLTRADLAYARFEQKTRCALVTKKNMCALLGQQAQARLPLKCTSPPSPPTSQPPPSSTLYSSWSTRSTPSTPDRLLATFHVSTLPKSHLYFNTREKILFRLIKNASG